MDLGCHREVLTMADTGSYCIEVWFMCRLIDN